MTTEFKTHGNVTRRFRSQLLLVFALTVVVVVSIQGLTDRRVLGQSTPLAERQRQAYDVGGLAAAARVNGTYMHVVPIAQNPNAPSGLEDLARLSGLIVIGTVDTNASHLSQDGRSISLLYRIKIERVLKGSAGRFVNVVLPGGQVTFPDGSVATFIANGLQLPSLGHRDVWFLARASEELSSLSTEPIFSPSFGGLGIYQLDTLKPVVPRGQIRSYLANSVFRMQLYTDAFVAKVEGLIR